MIRTLIFGAIAGYVGKKLYDDGKLTEFKDDLVARYNDAKAKLEDQRIQDSPAPVVTPATASGRPLAAALPSRWQRRAVSRFRSVSWRNLRVACGFSSRQGKEEETIPCVPP